jgi:hypothetical protein
MPAQPDDDLLYAADCPVCGRGGTVVTPDYCSEGHRICVDCGSALFVGPALGAPRVASSRTA